jgi:DNA-binding NtrC family response regulator
MSKTVAVLGSAPAQEPSLAELAWKFGWSVAVVSDIDALEALYETHDVVAVLFDPRALGVGWRRALAAVLRAAPGALPVVCQSFAEPLPWSEMAAAGAFHLLCYPFSAGELRQTLAFVSAARRSKLRPVALAPVTESVA